MTKSGGIARFLLLTLVCAVAAVPVFGFFKFERYFAGKENLPGNLTSGMDADENELWIGMYDPTSASQHQICVFDARTNQWTKTYSTGVGGVSVNVFRSISIVGNNVWVTGIPGAAVLDRETGRWRNFTTADGLPSVDVYCVAVKDNEIWFGTNEGIAVVDGSGKWRYITVQDGLTNNKVNYMLFEGPVLWACTESGISRLDTSSGEWRRYTKAEGLPGEAAFKALVDGDYIWFAMKGGVVRIGRKTNEIKAYTTADGLVSEEVKDIEVFGDKIYFATNQGLNYRDRTGEGKWKKITSKQGLPLRSDATHLAAQGDKLWIALWYEGVVRMSIPSGLAIIPWYVWVVVLGAVGIAALVIVRPGARKPEAEERAKRIQERRERVKAEKPPHEICGGVPQRQLCNRCGFNTLKAGKLYCSKYNKVIEYQKPSTPSPSSS